MTVRYHLRRYGPWCGGPSGYRWTSQWSVTISGPRWWHALRLCLWETYDEILEAERL